MSVGMSGSVSACACVLAHSRVYASMRGYVHTQVLMYLDERRGHGVLTHVQALAQGQAAAVKSLLGAAATSTSR